MTLELLASQIRSCTKCPLWKGRLFAVPGEGDNKAKLMIVGEAPGNDEDKEGRPFVGKSGDILNFSLHVAGIKREEVFITNIVKCHPPGNRGPHKEEIEICTENYLFNQIKLINPKVILLLGRIASKLFFPKNRYIVDLFDQFFDWNGRKLAVYYHPALALHRPNMELAIKEEMAEKLKSTKELIYGTKD